HCHTGYSLTQCQRDILQLRGVLARYPIELLGQWAWVLVRSQDWEPIFPKLKIESGEPCFQSIGSARDASRRGSVHARRATHAELMKEWQLTMSQLLELAVTHAWSPDFLSSGVSNGVGLAHRCDERYPRLGTVSMKVGFSAEPPRLSHKRLIVVLRPV